MLKTEAINEAKSQRYNYLYIYKEKHTRLRHHRVIENLLRKKAIWVFSART